MSDVFISYCSEDRALVDYIYSELNEKGVAVWYDRNLKTGVQWDKEIIKHLVASSIILPVLSKNSIGSDWIPIEVKLAKSLGKKVFPIILHKEVSIPSYLSEFQICRYTAQNSLHALIQRISEENLQGKFWYELFFSGLDIIIPLEEFGEVAGVNHRTLKTAFDLQQKLFKLFNPYLYNHNPLQVVMIHPSGHNLNPGRNWLFLGGPGAVSFVQSLVAQWANISEKMLKGYRYVVRPKAFKQGPLLRDTSDGRLGIENLVNGVATDFYECKQPSYFKDGESFSVIYTKGLGDSSGDGNKAVVLGAFSRHTLDGTVQFLMNETIRKTWLQKVTACGPASETLVRFRIGEGKITEFCGYDPPRSLSQQIG